ncbi:hypothetical protein DFH08DRAFT_854514 [Mycena albidolilacea]|uniref:Uncharacterized protein n=1 Tax=Mycena albidolilacea TaxID=1033008 RepID=A0AAD7ABJ6_9AGAR|nr:hypothetical protein DFH08DRAFT_854514 [Mycena albidolilacea]
MSLKLYAPVPWFPRLFSLRAVHVFSHIRVDGDLALEELQRLLEGLPSLAARVESLHLGDGRLRWIPTSPGFSKAHWQFPSLFVSLVRLCISIAVDWTNISENFRNSMQLTLRSPTITCLELAGLAGLPLTFLGHCPALRSLTLTRVFFHDPDNFDFAAALAACADSPPTQLEHLDLDLDTYELDFLSRWILIPESPLVIARHSFACTISDPVNHLYVQLLLNTSPSLQRLQLRKSSNSGLLDLRALGHLHTLSLDIPRPINQRVG